MIVPSIMNSLLVATAATVTLLMTTVQASHFAKDSEMHLFFEYNDNSPYYCNNESFFVPFEHMNLDHTNCSVVQTNAEDRFELQPFNDLKKTHHIFTGLVDLNNIDLASDSAQMKFQDNDTSFLLDYSINEADDKSCVMEQALVHIAGEKNLDGNTTLHQRWHCFNPFNLSIPSNSITYKAVVLKYLQSIESKVFFDLVLTLSGFTVKLEFRSGPLKSHNPVTKINWTISDSKDKRSYEFEQLWPSNEPQYIRNLLLLEFPGTIITNQAQFLKSYKMLSVGNFNFQFKQFIIYQVNTSTLYVVTSYNTGSKSSNITYYTEQMPFNFSRIRFISNEFILFEEPILVSDINGTKIPTNMNYFIRLALGQRLDSIMFKGFRNLTKGTFLFSYSSTDRYLRILDFQLPDLDGVIDESLISSFYYSKSDIDFLQFLEEAPTVATNRKYEPSTYRRVISGTHILEIYNEFNNTANKKTYIGVHSRITGAYLGEIMMPTNRTLLYAVFVEVENMLILSFDERLIVDSLPSLYFYKFTRPFIYFKTEFKSLNLPKDTNSTANSTTSLKVVCNVGQTDKTEEVFAVHFKMHDKFNDYFINTATDFKQNESLLEKLKPKPSIDESSNCYPDGLKVNIDINKQIPGSFFEEQYEGQPLAKFFSNPNLRHETYEVELETLDINMPIFFESKRGAKTTKTLVMDLASNTIYYKYKNGKFKYYKSAIDNRKVSKVDMVGEGDAIFNVSQNIFSLDIEDLTEKPLTGIGSFCQSVAYLRPPNLPDIVLCLSASGLEAHYMQERFSAQQTNIAITYKGFDAFSTMYTPKNLLYSREFPSILLILATKREQGSSKDHVIGIFDIFAINDIFVTYQSTMTMIELNKELSSNPDAKISNIDIHEGHICLAINNGVFFVYAMIERQRQTEAMTVEFQRKFDLANHFLPYYMPNIAGQTKTELSYKVIKYDKIWMYRARKEDESYQTEQVYERRMLFMLEINKTNAETGTPQIHRIIVIFDHRKSSYEAFTTILSGVDCEKLHMGPAFLLEGEKQRRTIALICEEPGTKWPENGQKVKLKVALLDAFENLLSFGNHKDIEKYTNSELKRKVINPKRYPINFYKSKHLLDLKALALKKDTKTTNLLQISATYSFCFIETYQDFGKHQNLSDQMTKIPLMGESAHIGDILGRDQKLIKKERINQYFEGHVFKTHIECESPMECRDMIINGTSQLIYSGELGNFSEYQTSEDAYNLDHLWINKRYNPNFELSYLMIKDSFIFSIGGQKSSIAIAGLGQNCSEFTAFDDLLIAICLYDNKLNFFRVFDIGHDMTYSDIVISFTNNRIIHPKSVNIRMRDDYIAIFTQNPFFRRYLTGLIFKVVRNNNYTSSTKGGSRFFSNPLQKDFGIWFLAESPMNDENVELMVYKTPKNPDRVYMWSLRRKTARRLAIRSIGYKIEEVLEDNTRVMKPTRVCDEKLLTMFFEFSTSFGGSYLLDHGSIMPLDTFTNDYFDVILTLPFSHDYLVRFKREALEKNSEDKNLNFTEDAKFLSISNPFFGIKESEPMRVEYSQDLYLVPANFYPSQSIVRMYFIDSELRNKAISLKENKFFDFKQHNFTVDGRASVSLVEGVIPTIYTFGLLNFSTFMTTVTMQAQFRQIEYFKAKLNSSLLIIQAAYIDWCTYYSRMDLTRYSKYRST